MHAASKPHCLSQLSLTRVYIYYGWQACNQTLPHPNLLGPADDEQWQQFGASAGNGYVRGPSTSIVAVELSTNSADAQGLVPEAVFNPELGVPALADRTPIPTNCPVTRAILLAPVCLEFAICLAFSMLLMHSISYLVACMRCSLDSNKICARSWLV